MNIGLRLEKFSKNNSQNYFELVSDERGMAMITGKPLGLEESKRDFEKLTENNNLEESFGNYKSPKCRNRRILRVCKT